MNKLQEGIYYVHIGDDNYAPTHSKFIRHEDKVHNPEAEPVSTFSDSPQCNPYCTCTPNGDGTWKIVCN